MKEVFCTKVEFLLVLVSSILTYTVGQISFYKDYSPTKIITPFHMNFSSDSNDELSGNTGISQEYYSKQLRQFFEIKRQVK